MAMKPETKQTITPAVATTATSATESTQTTTASTTAPTEKNATEKLKDAIARLDVERTALVKNTIENLKPGKPFDHAVIREINKIETRKNRLIVARFAALLKTSAPEVQAIVHQIIEI